MGIQITRPFLFEGNLPNFERDVINSALFVSQDPLNLSTEEGRILADKYDVGHIVWDVATRHHYVVESKTVSGGVVVGNFRLNGPITKTTQDWYDLGNSYIPAYGEIIVFTDHKEVNGKKVPTFKIGDGKTNPTELPFATTDYVENAGSANIANVAKKVEHPLHIGPHDYDGSIEVTVGVYDSIYEVK